MPNYFTLTPIGSDTPSKFVHIDELMCTHFNVPCDPDKWYRGWYDSVGMLIALGQDWDKIKSHDFWDQEDRDIIAWLEANYTTNAWYCHQ